MKKKFKVMLAMEDEDGKGTMTPLLDGDITFEYDPEANNYAAMGEVATSIAAQLKALPVMSGILPKMNKLMLGEKG